ncbi:PfkB family carbohydrate kinase [Ruegeria sp.]|uniref:PfkB family carbohydrate kinase n=1 Tax=Ruegeria sp. TaxID=1879320 RepID=UPI002324B010|nr:PfkB family carbohydrate kinase [Ruegeria sp.]MDA7965083.1 PfkB family carbohydrate kinase [Ruegeria sp.]
MTRRLLQMSGCVVDLLYEVDQVPSAGEEAIVRGFSIKPGGGFNAMVAASRTGMAVGYGGGIGSGPFAQIVREGLTAEGISCLRHPDRTRDQGCCTVLIDAQGERTFVASEGAEGHVSPGDLEQIAFAEFDWTLLSGYALHYAGSRDTLCHWLETAGTIPNLVFDPSPVVAAIPAQARAAALQRAHWVSANAREATILTGLGDPAEAAQSLAASRPGGAVVRAGSGGCFVALGGVVEHIPPYPVQVVDTNGAGDAHVGSFIARLSQGDTPALAARYANVAAAISTTQKGPATTPTRSVVADALNRKEAS